MSKLYITDELRKFRKTKGWSQQEAAGMLAVIWKRPVSLSTYQKWEQGDRNIQPDRALELSKFTKINLKSLVVWR